MVIKDVQFTNRLLNKLGSLFFVVMYSMQCIGVRGRKENYDKN